MSLPRIFQAGPFEIQNEVRLDDRASHYLMHVLRTKMGDKITLFNGKGDAFLAQVQGFMKKVVIVKVMDKSSINVESPLNLHLAQGIARGEKMDFIIQKAVELGVKKITPIITERCNVKLNADREVKRFNHWLGIIISACEQCGVNLLPILEKPVRLSAWLLSANIKKGFVLSPHGENASISHVLGQMAKAQSDKTTLLIGPEGGLTDEEIALANRYHFLTIKLGARILRTETASVAALSIVQSYLGDM